MSLDDLYYKNAGPWGAGLGVPLTSTQGDQNIYEIETAIRALQMAGVGAPGRGVASITVVGTQMKVNLTDGSFQGPFTLPTARWRYIGEATNTLPVAALDVITVQGQGVFIVEQNHNVALPFNPDRIISGQPAYFKVFGDDPFVYDFGFFIPFKPGFGVEAGGRMASHIFTRAVNLLATLPLSVAKLEVDPATDLVFDLRKNATTVGTLTFTAGNQIGVFSFLSNQSFAAGDRFSIIRAADVDADARELTITIAGRRGAI